MSLIINCTLTHVDKVQPKIEIIVHFKLTTNTLIRSLDESCFT